MLKRLKKYRRSEHFFFLFLFFIRHEEIEISLVLYGPYYNLKARYSDKCAQELTRQGERR